MKTAVGAMHATVILMIKKSIFKIEKLIFSQFKSELDAF